MSTNMDFKTALDEDMRNKGTNERLLGQMLGVSQQSINKWRQRGFPPLYRVEQLIHYFGPNSNIARLDFHRMIQNTPKVRVVPPINTPGQEFLHAPRTQAWSPPAATPVLDRAGWAREQKALVCSMLPAALRPHWEGKLRVGAATLTFDCLCDKAVMEIAVPHPDAPLVLSPSRPLLHLAAARTQYPDRPAIFAVITEDADRALPRSRIEIAKALGVEVMFFRNAHELAVYIIRACDMSLDDVEELEEIEE